MEKPVPHPWMLRLRDELRLGVPLARLRRRYKVDDTYIKRLFDIYGWEWTEVVTTAERTKKKGLIRLPGEARRLPDGATSVQLSERLRSAWLRYGLEGLHEGLAALESDLDLIVVENVGVDEAIHPTKLHLQRGDILRVSLLDDRSILRQPRKRSRSLIVRQALEQTILLRDDKELMKPPDWEAKPLEGGQGGQSAWTLPGKTVTKSFSIPLYLYSKIEWMRTPKGTTAHDPTKPNLSRWLRETIESVEPDDGLKALVPLPARKLKGYTISATMPLVLQPVQVERLIAIQSVTGCNQSEAVAVAVARRLGFKPDESVWLLWRAVATNGLETVATKLGIEVEVITDQLMADGYLKPSDPASLPVDLYEQIEKRFAESGGDHKGYATVIAWLRESISLVEVHGSLKRFLPERNQASDKRKPLSFALQKDLSDKLEQIRDVLQCSASEALTVAVRYRLDLEPEMATEVSDAI